MSRATVYLGPYVEWLLTPAAAAARFAIDPFYGNEQPWLALALDGKLSAAWTGPELAPEIAVRGRRYIRLPFVPCEFPPLRALPGLERDHSGVVGVADLRAIAARGVEAELNWLARVYASEIARLNDYMGRAGSLHWGIVAHEPG